MDYYLDAIRNWDNFGGRTSRKEYWMFRLFDLMFIIIFSLLHSSFEQWSIPFRSIYFFLIIIPRISINTRRLHDSGKSGWWQLVIIIPIIGIIIFVILMLQKSKD